ncbi:PucR family transcriptional regulator [Virgibacillus ndiopensis]|uniref:PucR family transcriptional regulator n=1 Tax=Virgibacillus ndiopensis TaxID=2004408 RepID=UPI000C08ABDE|nr:helix-turn-helix domain-containing protein [Virgibacillus ndiopensis]
MINKLREIFPSLILKSNIDRPQDNDFQWYITSSNEVIGIKKKELTKQAENVLSALLTPYQIRLPFPSEKEQYWSELIKADKIEQETESPYRFIYFSFAKNKLEPLAFKEAINEIFTRQIPILWETDHSGIIVEEQTNSTDEATSYEQIIDILMSDLYVKINFFVGPFLHQLSDAKSYYVTLIQNAEKSFCRSEKKVITYVEAIPYLIVEKIGPAFRTMIAEIILKEIADDHELLYTIETFIDCNLNISITAKELFMHRNSLQYRIDKFIEKTGIDIRDFNQAMTVHLALLSKNYID